MPPAAQPSAPRAHAVYVNEVLLVHDVLLGECSISQTYEYFQFTFEERVPVWKHRTSLVTVLVPHTAAESLRTQLNSLLALGDLVTCRIESTQWTEPFMATGYLIAYCTTQQDRLHTHISFRLEHRLAA